MNLIPERPPWSSKKTRKFQARLLDWYGRSRRELPWRNRPEPYLVWIAEIMLQQTQVQTVLPYYERFLNRFPDVPTLAAAAEQEILASWAGLGYYSRARNLHRAAKMIVLEHEGRFPDTFEEILRLPGVGRYTAGAVHSIAFNQPQPVVDGNVRRVIGRLHGVAGKAPDSFFWNQAAKWVPEGKASDFNQAVMELGALICVPSSPLCPACPVQTLCAARRGGFQDRIPPPRHRRATEAIRLVMLVLERAGCILLTRRRDAVYIPGEWGLPTRILQAGESPDDVARLLAGRTLQRRVSLQARSSVRHSVTYRQIITYVFYRKLRSSARVLEDKNEFRWTPYLELDHFLTSSAFLKAVCSATDDGKIEGRRSRIEDRG